MTADVPATALEVVISRVNTYTGKTIAHRDDNPNWVPAAPSVTWAELDVAALFTA
jgi:hypothetical protein